ncbi:hypothetical protein [Streptomyces zaomyceticus]|uniref:hypothetical protein n=1 Tax=Streptomyces zaomyceticus TaxID=68286 RepID=UPI003417715B
MTTPAAPVNLPPQQCPPPLLGHCARCQAPCHRYGFGGNPLSLGVGVLWCDVR